MHKVGEVCTTSGSYECSFCGYKTTVKKGDKFPICPGCGRKDITWSLVSKA
jgi:rubrerythrin